MWTFRKCVRLQLLLVRIQLIIAPRCLLSDHGAVLHFVGQVYVIDVLQGSRK